MFTSLLAWFRRTRMPGPVRHVVLRDERTPRDLRHLDASYSGDGDLVIEGQDLGDSVEAAFGYREYEWTWTIARADLPKLAQALDSPPDVLLAFGERFRGPAAAGLSTFLEEHGIPYKGWSRIGD